MGQLRQVDLPDGKAGRLTDGRHDSAPQFPPDGTMIAFVRQTDAGCSQLVAMPSPGGKVPASWFAGCRRYRTEHGQRSHRRECPDRNLERRTGACRGGAVYAAHGFLDGASGQWSAPVSVNIHRGPFTASTKAVLDEFQVNADAGYAEAFCDPRGAPGYGDDDDRAIRKAMGTVHFHGVVEVLDGDLAGHPQLDSSRLGIMGGSYCGYLTAWVTAHYRRFTAAIVKRVFLDLFSFAGTSDIGSFFGDGYVGTDAEELTAHSPLAHVDAMTTPTFVIPTENDLRCPLEQGQRHYAALKRQGTPVELLIFPGETQELSRSGRPIHRAYRFESIRKWWARFLPMENNRLMGTEG